MLEKKAKALAEEAKLTAEELDCEGFAMDKYSAVSQHLVQVEDEITMISASLNQWLDVSSDSEQVDGSDVNYVEVINDENTAKNILLERNEENCGFVNEEKVDVLSSIAEMIDIGNKAKNVVLENNVDNIGLGIKHKKNIADSNNKADIVNLERNIENGSQVNKQMEAVEIESNSSGGNFISFTDLINGKEMLDINENIDITEKSCSPANTNKAVDDENMADLVKETVVVMPKPKNELVSEIRSDSLGSTWEDDNTRHFYEDVIEKSKLPALSSGETNSKVSEWLNSKRNDVNTSSSQTTSVKSFRAKLCPKKDVGVQEL